MSRTYKDAPYWVKLKRQAVDYKLANSIKPGLVDKKLVSFETDKLYSHYSNFSVADGDIRRIIRKSDTHFIASEKHIIEDDYASKGFDTVEIREIVSKFYNKNSDNEKLATDFSYINKPLVIGSFQSFIVNGTKDLIVLSLARYYSVNDSENLDLVSFVELRISLYEVNGFNDDYEILISRYQFFNYNSPDFHYDPSLTACSCIMCVLDKQSYNVKKLRLPKRGGKQEFKKRLNDYKKVYNFSNNNPDPLEDKI